MDVIIADDSKAVRDIVQDVCSGLPWDLTPHHAENGDQAQRLLMRIDTGVAFLDINMPGMTGLEALAHARKADRKIMAVVMSSTDGYVLRTAATELGAYDYLVKPFTAKQIEALLCDAYALLSSHRVLIVDDIRPIRLMLAGMVRHLGSHYQIDEAEDAETALRKMRSGLFDTVLLDLTMPGLSGLEALPLLKAANPKARVIVVTGHADPETMAACRAAGANGFLTKPVRGDRLAKLMGDTLVAA